MTKGTVFWRAGGCLLETALAIAGPKSEMGRAARRYFAEVWGWGAVWPGWCLAFFEGRSTGHLDGLSYDELRNGNGDTSTVMVTLRLWECDGLREARVYEKASISDSVSVALVRVSMCE